VSAVLGAGTLAGLRHEFREQLRLGREAQRLEAGLAALPVIADAQVELGRYGAAVQTVQRLLDVKPNLTSYARASYLRELSGDTAGAIDAMRLAASAGGAPENVAYVETLRGDLELQRGRVEAARRAYISAQRSLPAYPGSMVGLARADAADGDLGRAAVRLRRAAQRLPRTSTLNLLGQVEGALGHQAAAAAALDTARAQPRLYRAAATAPDAEAVLFEADHGSPAAAVELGRRVWRAAPSVRSADALGWALTRSGRPAAGYRFALRALALGSRDSLFRLHAGIAAKEAGLARPAARHLRIAAGARAALGPDALALLAEAKR
jgi:tetratricopeptide (TPR) repeat protein